MTTTQNRKRRLLWKISLRSVAWCGIKKVLCKSEIEGQNVQGFFSTIRPFSCEQSSQTLWGFCGWDITQRRFEHVVLYVRKVLDSNCAFVDNAQPRRGMRCISGWPYFSSQDWMSTDWNWFTMKALIVVHSKLNGFTMDLLNAPMQ